MSGARVCVAGSLHLDVVLNAPRLPRLDETLIGSGVAYAFGGKGGNQALAAARLGAAVSMAGRVGDDAFGALLLDRLAEAGVDHAQVLRRPGASGMSAAIVDAHGDYGAVVVSAANLEIQATDIVLPPDTGILVLQNEIPQAVNVALARAAQARGIPVLLNAAPFRDLPGDAPDLFGCLVVNRVEARDMTGISDPQEAARALRALGFADVILTLGGAGLIHGDSGGIARQAGFAIDAVSTHGAGDAFVGALAARLVAGDDVATALPFAQAAAALHVATPVARRDVVTAGQVVAFLNDCPD